MKGMHRSKSAKKRFVKTPKKTALHFEKKKKGQHRCAECGRILHGVTREKKSASRPSRIYGGYLCHACVRQRLVESVRT